MAIDVNENEGMVHDVYKVTDRRISGIDMYIGLTINRMRSIRTLFGAILLRSIVGNGREAVGRRTRPRTEGKLCVPVAVQRSRRLMPGACVLVI